MISFDLRNACNELMAELKAMGNQNNVIKLSVDIQLPDVYAGDPKDFFQIFRTLAGYYTQALVNGLITIEILLQSRQGNAITLRVHVSGKGILKTVEEDWRMIDQFITASGKNIVRKVGDAEVTFEFPYQLKTVDEEKTPNAFPFSGKHALIAEDNEINALVFASFLEEWGCRSMVAGNGLEAVTLARQHAFDIILMDIHMPELGGGEATRQIRGFSTVPIVALTASTQETDIKHILEAGANNFLIKPVSSSHLFQILSKYL
jgi:CheY-like chemotaxis protein